MSGSELYDLQPVAEIEVRGLRNRYRRPGIGAPLAAKTRPLPGVVQVVPVPPLMRVPLTAVVRIDAPLAGLRTGDLHGHLDLFASLDTEIGRDRRPCDSARIRADRVAGGVARGVAVLEAGAADLSGQRDRRAQGERALRAAPLPARADSGRVRARHGLEPGALGRHGQRPDRRRASCASATRTGSSPTTRAIRSRTPAISSATRSRRRSLARTRTAPIPVCATWS